MLKELVIDYHYRLPRPDGQSREEAVSLHNLLASNTATHLDRQKITTGLFASEITKSLPNPTTRFPPTTASAREKTGKNHGRLYAREWSSATALLHYLRGKSEVRELRKKEKKRKKRCAIYILTDFYSWIDNNKQQWIELKYTWRTEKISYKNSHTPIP